MMLHEHKETLLYYKESGSTFMKSPVSSFRGRKHRVSALISTQLLHSDCTIALLPPVL